MIDYSIRRADQSDLSLLDRLLQAKAEFDGARDALSASELEFGAAVFRDDSPCELIVADTGDTLVGFAAFYPVFWMDDLFVTESAQSLGIGRAILVDLVQEATR